MSNATNSNANISKSKNISSVFCCLSGICIKFRMLWKKIPASEIISFWNYRLQKAGLLKSVKIPLSEHFFFFLSGFYFTETDDSQDWRGREGTIFYFTLPLPPAHEHSDIYLQLCMWDDYHIFLIASFVFTRLLLDEIYRLIELPFDWLMMWH